MLTPQERRSRETAMVAERHWWVSRLEIARDAFRINAELNPQSVGAWEGAANYLDVLIQERTK